MSILRVRNWDRWQTYRKDRSAPPWIKVHCRLLHDPEWNQLTDALKGQLISLWILAADRNGTLPNDKNMLKRLCCIDEPPDIELFVRLGFFEIPATTKKRKSGNQEKKSGMPRERVEAEAETEAEADKGAPPTMLPNLDVPAWERWCAYRAEIRKPVKPASMLAAQRQLAAFGCDQAAVVEQSIANGWQGLFELKSGGGSGQPATHSRAKRVADRLDAIARADIESRGGITQTLGGGDIQTLPGEVREQVDVIP